jgi:uncharacterized protein
MGWNVKLWIAASLVVALNGAALAQTQPQPQPNPVAAANQGTVGVITGMEGGTYARTAADLTILDNEKLRVLPVIGKGSLQNLSDILYLRGIDVGFVQADALTFAKQHNMFPSLAQNIRYIAKLYDEEVHVLARKDITRIEDLKGQRVNVDVVGSGSAMTAEILLKVFGIAATVEHQMQVTGVQELKRGEIAAIIHVGGAPIPLLADVTNETGLHFVPVPIDQTLAQTYLPDQLTHGFYPRLIADDAPVSTLAVGDVMAVFGWQPHTERYDKVARFVDAFFGKFDQFQQPPRHPKWREVNISAEVPGWVRFQAAQDWLARRTTVGFADPASSQSPPNKTRQGARGRPADAERDASVPQLLGRNGQQPVSR